MNIWTIIDGPVSHVEPRTMGRMSDHSDWRTALVTVWTATVVDSRGAVAIVRIEQDAQPDATTILAAAPVKTDEATHDLYFSRWQKWKTTRIEAQARGLAAAVISKLQTREDNAFDDYKTATLALADNRG